MNDTSKSETADSTECCFFVRCMTYVNTTFPLNGTLYSESTEEDKQKILYQFITYGVLINFIGLFGIFGNVISMIILSRPQMKSSINYLLIGLARCDTVLLITSILLFGLPSIYQYTGYLFTYYFRVYPHITPYVFPIALIAQTVSIYLTLTVTLERFVAVCHPLQVRSLCTYGRARLYVILIIIFSTIYNLPRFWDVCTVELVLDDYNGTIFYVEPSDLRSNQLYISIYIHWMYLLFFNILPFSGLTIFNIAIYKQVRQANQERQRLSRLQKKEIGLATMLLCVVVVFIICNFPALVVNFLEAFYNKSIDELVKTSNLLITINSSVNFIIYVIFGEKFKRLFFKLFCSNRLFGFGIREDGANPDENSVASNGDGRGYSLRSTHSCRIHRTGTTVMRNGSTTTSNGSTIHRSLRVPRAPSPGPCVYYPARSNVGVNDWDSSHANNTRDSSVITTTLNSL